MNDGFLEILFLGKKKCVKNLCFEFYSFSHLIYIYLFTFVYQFLGLSAEG